MSICISISIIYWLYQNYFLDTTLKEKQAIQELSYAESYLSHGLMDQALNYNMKHHSLGLIGILNKYPDTQAGNISKFYAGICYYKLGQYEKSIHIMKSFDSKDELLLSMKYGFIGDSFAQLNNNNEAIKNYLKASNISNNTFTTPLYYYKSAILNFEIKQYKASKLLFDKIVIEYPSFFYYDNVEKYLMFIANKI
ncbi:tetratricopeptide repeat protein [Blattabacterium cuenoti]|uniref:tetratricopeptide repeat protein n=1 Tax=Blattabacterium cuenoti TaxID=1653831 RepID=UPI001EEC0B09|nr:tetratricopeptide repeat protein [Blattabacterium cuenoti]